MGRRGIWGTSNFKPINRSASGGMVSRSEEQTYGVVPSPKAGAVIGIGGAKKKQAKVKKITAKKDSHPKGLSKKKQRKGMEVSGNRHSALKELGNKKQRKCMEVSSQFETKRVSDPLIEKITGYIGKLVRVTGKVVTSHIAKSGTVRFLNFGANPNAAFTAVIFTNDLEKFRVLGEPTEYYLHKKVALTGTLEMYKGKPQIILKTTKQITVTKQN